MDAHRWQRVREVFDATIAQTNEDRSTFLAEACRDDEELRLQIEGLVRAHERTSGFLDAPALAHPLLIFDPDELNAVATLTSYRAGALFTGTERFRVMRQLGAGGMGVVYEVHDRTRNEVVALKTLLRARAADVYRLKREFRRLADVAHPNLVSLYELVVDGTNCFFTMELVNGVNLVEYVRGAMDSRASVRADRARRVLRQLVDGIAELHRRGKLHRDIKPSNLLVTPAGRLVILDFGLTSDVFLNDRAIDESLAGTPAYLAPERRSGVAPSESEDWYGVGVTLYEALTGRVPFEGSFEEMRRRKRESDPGPPADIDPGVPDDLNAICMGMLRRNPVRRLSGTEAVQMFEPDVSLAAGTRWSEVETEPIFVGRHQHLDALRSALHAAKHGSATAVYVHGPSGIGKSSLVQYFLNQLSEREPVAVLRGRCYEHESVPYKALDGVIDSLSQHLSSMPQSDAEPLMPPDAVMLARLFPVMLQVPAVASGHAVDHEDADPLTLRQRAFAALRELLTRLTVRQPLVIYIDDLHWADADSAVLLEELLRQPQAPPLLMIACVRTEEISGKPFLKTLLEPAGWKESLPLWGMTDGEAHALLASILSTERPLDQAQMLEIAQEAGGSPLLLRQLAGYATLHQRSGIRATTLAEMLDERFRRLSDGAQRFLQMLAICGRPMAPELVHEASGLEGDERPLVARLRTDHLLRSSGSAQRIELYHDRIRETLAASVSSEDSRRLHALMACTLVARGVDEPEALYDHYRGAGDPEKASAQAALAAKKADAALAFDRAAMYYRSALDLGPGSESHPHWKEALAAALANAGRPTEAAEAFLVAAGQTQATRRVELQRLAAEQFLTGGHIDRGLVVIRAVLREVGIRPASSPRMVLASLIMRRAQLRWRGFEFVPREADLIPQEDLLRIDTCWSMMTGLSMVETIHAADFHTRQLLLALEAGEPYRIARGLATEVGFAAIAGGPSMRRAAELIERADAIARSVGSPHAIALSTLGAGVASFMVGQWKRAVVSCERALSILRDHCVGVTWEIACAQTVVLGSLAYEGEIHEVSRRVHSLLATAREHGNLFVETELRTRMTVVWLAADNPDEGERQANEVMGHWSQQRFSRQHYNHLLARIYTEIYRGRSQQAWQLIADNWRAIRRSLLLRIQWVRIEALYVRARCALLMATGGGGFLLIARDAVRRIAREQMPWSDPLALLLEAAVESLEGREDMAIERLAAAVEGFDRADMRLHGAVARRRLGAVLGGERGHELIREADDWMAAEGIVNPHRMTRLFAPGFPDNLEN